uniref:Uncharacterized protein n=1 Tax=Gadus morhua TaxID=8049 RepID=A0A8C5FNG7_GADMO
PPPVWLLLLSDSSCLSDSSSWFIRKVYLTLMMQLLITVGVILIIFTFCCCAGLRRRVPLNYIALGLVCPLISINSYFAAEAVLWAMGATALVSFSLSMFAMQSKWDFTALRGCLWAFVWTLVSFGLLCAIMRSQYLNILYACIGTLFFSIYLVVDTHQMVGKNRKHSISPEEYIFAALTLYLDIFTLFLLLLEAIGMSR